MKILKEGKKQERPRRVTCGSCKSKLEYTTEDIQYDRDGKHIICPVCEKFITVS